MPFRSRRLAFSALLSVAGITLAAANDREAALRLLVHAFDRVGPRNVVAIMQLPLQGSGSFFETVKVQVDTAGRQKTTVLQPIHESGLVILDLSSYREIYNPDEQSLTIGFSPTEEMIRPEERLALVRRNYRVSMTKVSFAGQTVARVDAVPVHAGLCTEHIYIDPTSYFVLKVESEAADGKRRLHFDTKAVSYPEHLDPGVFKLDHVTITRTEHLTQPVPVKNAAQAGKKVGFEPLVPRQIPLGFEIRKTYVRIDSSTHYVVFNLSDGIASAAVFQMKRNKVPAAWKSELKQHPSDYFWRGDVLVRIVSDLEPSARKTLLQSFRHAERVLLESPEKPFNPGESTVLPDWTGTKHVKQFVTAIGSGWRTPKQFG